jgi:hypothetical protein
LEPSDVDLFDKSFGSAKTALFLMIGPVPGLAAFYFRTDENLECVHEFRFPSPVKALMMAHRRGGSSGHANPDSQAAVSDDAPSAEPTLTVQPELTGVAQLSSIRQPARGSVFKNSAFNESVVFIKSLILENRGWAKPAAIALLALLAIGGAFGALRREASPDRAPEYVHLSVQPSESSLRLLWDRNAPIIRSANHAILHIQDGNQQRDTNLPPAQLAAGSLTYQPQSLEVNFRLEVFLSQPAGVGLIKAANFAPDSASTRKEPHAPYIQPPAKRPISTRPRSR